MAVPVRVVGRRRLPTAGERCAVGSSAPAQFQEAHDALPPGWVSTAGPHEYLVKGARRLGIGCSPADRPDLVGGTMGPNELSRSRSRSAWQRREPSRNAGSMGSVGTVDHAALDRALAKLDKATTARRELRFAYRRGPGAARGSRTSPASTRSPAMLSGRSASGGMPCGTRRATSRWACASASDASVLTTRRSDDRTRHARRTRRV